MSTQELTGYYRYTDIWFYWHLALPNEEDGRPLKAFFAHDSLTHVDHPLRRKGDDGIQMFMGTLSSGESRLLFSFKQVDYARYWLHEMQLTRQVIPLPYSDCLLVDSELRGVSPVVYKTGGDLRNALKRIEKNNKRIKSNTPALNSRRDLFERIRTFWADKTGAWCAMDFEAWDRDHTMITEFGWSAVKWQDGEKIEEKGHLIIRERRMYTNTYVAQYRDNYSFGDSQDVDKVIFRTKIHELINRLRGGGPLFLVFHDNSQDIKYLKSTAIAAPIDEIKYFLPDKTPKDGLFVVDTAEMFAALEGEGAANKRSLEFLCRALDIPHAFLHNAGNDAHCTLLSMIAMASGDPLDIQRENRWPARTGESNGTKVHFTPWEEDAISDDNCVMPATSGYDPDTGNLIDEERE